MNIKNFLKLPASKYSIRTIVSWLWGAWRGNRLQAILNASIGLLDVAVSLAQVWAVKNAIDVAAGTTDGNIYVAVAIFGILILASFALSISAIWVRNILGIKAQNQMQCQLLDRMLRAEWHGKESRHSGDVLNRLETDVNVVVDFLAETIPNTLSVLALFIGAFWYLFSMDAMLAIVTIAIIPLFILLSKLYVRQMRNLTRTVRNSDSKVQSVLQETIQNRMLIKTLESGDAMVGKLAGTQQELRQNVVRKTTFSVFSNLILNVGFAAGYLVAFLWAAIRLSQHTLTFGGMTAFLQLVNKIQGPARNLTKLVPAFVSVLTAAERLMELEEDPMEEQGDSIPMEAPCGIRFDNVSYAYDNEEQLTINNLSFDFKPGSCTALLGETGAGKTTIVRMILALLKPKSGAITIYNNKVEEQLSPLLRCNLVYVPQGNTLMSGTIRDNLLLGKPDATEEEMKEALKKSCAEFVMQLPDGIDTICTEKGGGLSEGQAQRIAIARALLRNRPIMIFDESTSALDPETERQLLANILSKKDKTIIFVTHRPAVVEYCDQTLKINKQ